MSSTNTLTTEPSFHLPNPELGVTETVKMAIVLSGKLVENGEAGRVSGVGTSGGSKRRPMTVT